LIFGCDCSRFGGEKAVVERNRIDFWMWLQQVWRRKGGGWKEKSYFLF